MTNDDKLILSYFTLLNHLRSDLKIRLVTKLLESINTKPLASPSNKSDDSWEELFGVWATTTEEDLHLKVRAGRLPNRDVPNFDA